MDTKTHVDASTSDALSLGAAAGWEGVRAATTTLTHSPLMRPQDAPRGRLLEMPEAEGPPPVFGSLSSLSDPPSFDSTSETQEAGVLQIWFISQKTPASSAELPDGATRQNTVRPAVTEVALPDDAPHPVSARDGGASVSPEGGSYSPVVASEPPPAVPQARGTSRTRIHYGVEADGTSRSGGGLAFTPPPAFTGAVSIEVALPVTAPRQDDEEPRTSLPFSTAPSSPAHGGVPEQVFVALPDTTDPAPGYAIAAGSGPAVVRPEVGGTGASMASAPASAALGAIGLVRMRNRHNVAMNNDLTTSGNGAVAPQSISPGAAERDPGSAVSRNGGDRSYEETQSPDGVPSRGDAREPDESLTHTHGAGTGGHAPDRVRAPADSNDLMSGSLRAASTPANAPGLRSIQASREPAGQEAPSAPGPEPTAPSPYAISDAQAPSATSQAVVSPVAAEAPHDAAGGLEPGVGEQRFVPQSRQLDVSTTHWRDLLSELVRQRLATTDARGATALPITLQLRPAALGQVLVNLRLNATGAVEMRVVAPHDRTRRFFNRESGALAAAFAREGLNVASIEIAATSTHEPSS